MRWFDAARARLRLLASRRAAEHRMDEEFQFHVDMAAQRMVREAGVAPDEARRRALVAFGGLDRHREDMRDGRGLAWLGGLRLDLKLGFRMLVKYPGLTLVGGLAMAFAIWVGTVTFSIVALFVNPTLPLPNGDRIVELRNWDVAENVKEPRALADFVAWRGAMRSVAPLGAYRDVSRNLVADDGRPRVVDVAEISASAFTITSATPALGRVLVESDEAAGAPPVAVIGHDLWRTRFAADPNVVGRSVRIGEGFATIVGVMPASFKFPVAHEMWMPLRVATIAHGARTGPSVTVFGRLADGATLEGARAELTALGRRAAAEQRPTHEHLQAQVAPYAHSQWEPTPESLAILLSVDLFAVLLLTLVCGNVALLLFARAVSREGELIVRSALGASRGRIIAQLFAEALVLGAVATAIGLAAAHVALGEWGYGFLERNMGRVPFWLEPRLSPGTIAYALGLTLLSAVIAGAMPARKVTRGLGARLKAGTSGGGGMRFGGVWTVVIVAQVAATVVFPGAVMLLRRELAWIESYDNGYAAQEFLTAELSLEANPGASEDSAQAVIARRRFEGSLESLRQRLQAEPGVAGVTFVDRLPRNYHVERRIEVDGITPRTALMEERPEVSVTTVDLTYFDVLDAPPLAGRLLQPADLAEGAQAVVVDRGFVERVLGGRNAIGQRLRIVDTRSRGEYEPGPWLQVVGVAKDLGVKFVLHRHRAAGIYFPMVPGAKGRVSVMIHTRGDPAAFGPRLREIAAVVDPALRLEAVRRGDAVGDELLWILNLWLRMATMLVAVTILLSLAAIYAVLAFTVARRTREIGVRVALGATRRGVLTAIFRRPLTQVAWGILIGSAIVAAGALVIVPGVVSPQRALALLGYAAVMFGVCLLACVVPTRRALRIQPTEALRAE